MNFISKRYLQYIFDIYFDSNSIQHNNKNSQIKTQRLPNVDPTNRAVELPETNVITDHKEEMQRDK